MVQLVLPVVLLLSLQLTDSDDVRLVGGASHCEGEPQVKHLNRWREVHIPDFLLLTAAGICRRLNCGSAVSHKRRDRSYHSSVKLDTVCVQSSSPLSQCVRDDDFSSDRRYSIICSESVRLLHGSSQCSGALEVNRNQSWTLVCEEDFDLKDAEVVCRELGCGDPSLLQGTPLEEGFAPVRQMFQCEGHESALMDCPRSKVIQNNCPSGKVVLLSCFEPLRLTGGSDACAGTLELRHRAQWRRVFVRFELQNVAAKACHLLGCGTPLSAKFTNSLLDRPMWELSSPCIKKASLFRDCLYIADATDTQAVEVKCSDSDIVRLVGGASHCKGEPQVKHLNRWREVHIEDFLLLTAAGVCRRLNCGSAVSHERRDSSSHSAVELDAECVQSSSPLSQCVRDDDFSSNHLYSITCSDSVRLLHGSSQCSGSLEVNRNQSWTLVCDEDFDLKDAEVVCRELGCGDPSLLQGALYGEGFAPVRQMLQCEGHESALMDCPRSSVIQNNCPSFKAVLLLCLGKPTYLLLLWLVPAVTVIFVAVIVLIVCKRKTSSSNAQGTIRRSEPCNPENVEYDNTSMFEDHVYQDLSPGTMDPEYIELHPEPLSSTPDAVN